MGGDTCCEGSEPTRKAVALAGVELVWAAVKPTLKQAEFRAAFDEAYRYIRDAEIVVRVTPEAQAEVESAPDFPPPDEDSDDTPPPDADSDDTPPPDADDV